MPAAARLPDRVEQFRVRGIFRSGNAGLGFQKGNLRCRFLAVFIEPFKVADPRSPIRL
jgi:hypothetical protein